MAENILDDMYIIEKLVQDSGYTEIRIPKELRDEADYILVQRELGASGIRAEAEIGSGVDGVLTVELNKFGLFGNDYSLNVVITEAVTSALDVSMTDKVITITLATDGLGDLDDTANTVTDIYDTFITFDSDLEFIVTVSGLGNGIISTESSQSFIGGVDYVAESNVSRDYQIIKVPSESNILYTHVSDAYRFLEEYRLNTNVTLDSTDVIDEANILVVTLNGKWIRNY